MSKIPCNFCWYPSYFRKNGLIKNLKNLAFITWCFSRCSNEPHIWDHGGILVNLLPLQFVFGRKICSEETGLTEDEVRTQQNRWENLKMLKKAPNKTPNKFTIYEWSWEVFSEKIPQENHQLTPNRPPTDPHNQDQDQRSKKNHHLDIPIVNPIRDDDLMIDDFSLADHLEAGADLPTKRPKIHIYGDIHLTPKQLDECLKVKKDIETIRLIVHQVVNWKGRCKPIKDWVTTIIGWNTNNTNEVAERAKTNAVLGKKLEAIYGFSEDSWRCKVYRDKLKDQHGMLFEHMGNSYAESEFVPFVDLNFKERITDLINRKKMQKSRN